MDRLIDADALYEQIAKKEELARQRVLDTPSRMPNGDFNPSAMRYATQLDERTQMKFMIADAPTIDAVPHWIPCSERLPEENRTVIASTEYGVFPEARYTKEDGWEWAYESGADYWEKIAEVKAWMPLPKPYEVKE